jgi:hypothetical protein
MVPFIGGLVIVVEIIVGIGMVSATILGVPVLEMIYVEILKSQIRENEKKMRAAKAEREVVIQQRDELRTAIRLLKLAYEVVNNEQAETADEKVDPPTMAD